MRQVLGVLKDGSFTLKMDNGARIKVKISIQKNSRRARIDFTGTSKQTKNNFNAPAAVCKAAVLYVFRTLIDDDIPLNGGCLKPLDGGEAGKTGVNRVVRADGTIDELGPTDATRMNPGDVFVIETPGGGGFGKK